MLITNDNSQLLNTDSALLSEKGQASHVEINKMYNIARQTERELQQAIDSNRERNEQLTILLDRSNLLLHKNEVFGTGVMDYRKNMERKQFIDKIKYIVIGVLLLTVIVLVVIVNIISNRTNISSNRNSNVILE